MSKYTFDPTDYNPSNNEVFSDILKRNISRRQFVQGSLSAIAMTALSSGCVSSPRLLKPQKNIQLNFDPVPPSLADKLVVPSGYSASTLAPWGAPLFRNVGSLSNKNGFTSWDQALSTGQNHDGMHFFPLNDSNTDGLLCVNHEYVNPSIHQGKPTEKTEDKRSSIEQVLKEINAHGVSVFRIKNTNGVWKHVIDDKHNRRITAETPIKLSGPITGKLTQTAFSNDGDWTRGTLNNCGSGVTPWGTYLSCEENWPDYFTTDKQTTSQKRIGIGGDKETWYGWEDLADHPQEKQDQFKRFDNSITGSTAKNDYRNEANGFGYIVEIDPYSPDSPAVKRTAMGRFRHECCYLGKLEAGKPLTFYSGHDGRFEYIYKFVSSALWDPRDASPTSPRLEIGAKYMDEGTLYVAKFNADNSGSWIPLVPSSKTSDGKRLSDHFSSINEILLTAPLAADLVGATPMDRPEWTSVDPITGEVYFTLTNNTKREEKNPANPRTNNQYGHIIRWKESPSSINDFNWEIFIYGGDSTNKDNPSGLKIENEFASPDGLIFDPRGILWIQTDNGDNEVGKVTNNQMLAVIPSSIEGNVNEKNQSEVKRFLVGPTGCEITGISFTPDLKTMFVNIQHPDNWPYKEEDATIGTPSDIKVTPRSATVVITKDDGGQIGV